MAYKGRKVVFDASLGWENDYIFIQNISTTRGTLHLVGNIEASMHPTNTKFAELLQAFNQQKKHGLSGALCDYDLSVITESRRLHWKSRAIVWSLPCGNMPTAESMQLCDELAHFSYGWSKGKSLACSMAHVVQDDKVFFYNVLFHEQEESNKFRRPYDQDLGMFGILMFFKKHKCTAWCKDFEKPSLLLDAKDQDFDKRFPTQSHRASCYTRSLSPDPLVVVASKDVFSRSSDNTYYFTGRLLGEYVHAIRPPDQTFEVGQNESSSSAPYMMTDNTGFSRETTYENDGFGNTVLRTTSW